MRISRPYISRDAIRELYIYMYKAFCPRCDCELALFIIGENGRIDIIVHVRGNEWIAQKEVKIMYIWLSLDLST